MSAVNADANGQNSVAVTGKATGENSIGVYGSADVHGLYGEGGANGIFALGKTWCGVAGYSQSTTGGVGVYGENTAGGTGVMGKSSTWHAVAGFTDSTTGGYGVYGEGAGGVAGIGKAWIGVYGESHSTNGGSGVWGEHKGNGTGVFGLSSSGVGVCGKGGRLAGYFEGDVEITGDIRLLNADCAEDFDICETENVEAGTVMVLGEEGVLYPSQQAYDKRVAGVVSGAGQYKPGIVLDKQDTGKLRKPIALMGKVYCKVDAEYGDIEIGDLLTTSPTPGHAMKVSDPLKAFGTVIGKALRPFSNGQGLVPVLIALQ